MTKLSDHQSSEFVKLFLIGNSGAGKTGALASLVQDGYELRIIDLDNGLDALKNQLEEDYPEGLEMVDYETVIDQFRTNQLGKIVPKGAPKAYVQTGKLIDKWTDGTIPAEWGPKTIFVIDSLTALGHAALHWAKAGSPSVKDGRQWYGTAQESIMDILVNLSGEEFRANVILISHIDYRQLEKDGPMKGFISTVGKALGPKTPHRFNTVLESRIIGFGKQCQAYYPNASDSDAGP